MDSSAGSNDSVLVERHTKCLNSGFETLFEAQHFYEFPYIPLLPPPRVLLCSSQIPHSPSLLLLRARRQEPPRAGNDDTTIDKETEKHCEDERRSNSENSDQVCVTLWTLDVLGSDRRGNRGAGAVFRRHKRVKSLCLHLLWGAGPDCSLLGGLVDVREGWRCTATAMDPT